MEESRRNMRARCKLSSLKAIHIVHMKGCPHCIVAIDEFGRAAQKLSIPCMLYDVQADDVRTADQLVRRFGDWSEDYIVPQVFFEEHGGEITHVLTGYPEGLQFTKRAIDNVLSSEFFQRLAGIEKAYPTAMPEEGGSADSMEPRAGGAPRSSRTGLFACSRHHLICGT